MTSLRRPEAGVLSAEEWEALLYDWHNSHRLRRQQSDVRYWLDVTGQAKRLLVLGAGTGRVAAPLARDGRHGVTALDASPARLARMPRLPGLLPVCGDMRRLPLRPGFDAAVVPYSTWQLLRSPQDRQRALAEAARVLAPGAALHIDVSANFDTRTAVDWHRTLAQPCEEVGATVEEWERHIPRSDHVLIEKSFRVGERVLADVREHWVHLGALDLESALDEAGFDLTHVDRGYGAGASAHRLIHHARRRS